MEASKISQEEVWKRSIWNPEHIAEVIAISADMVRVVGSKPHSSGKTFSASVHKELLCYFSPYYTAALKGGFSEAKKETITLDLPYDQISDLITWLYSGNIINTDSDDLLGLYVFADEKMMLALRRSIMTKMVQTQDLDEYPMDVREALPYLNRIPESSGLFRYLVDYWVCVWSRASYDVEIVELDEEKRIPRAFFYHVMKKLAALGEGDCGANLRQYIACMERASNYHNYTIDEFEQSPGVYSMEVSHPDSDYYDE